MKNKVLTILGAILVVAGAVIAAVSDIAIADLCSIVVAVIGAVLTCVQVYKKSEKKGWKVILAIALLVLGAGLLGFAGVSSDTVTQLVTATVGLVALITGLFVSLKQKE